MSIKPGPKPIAESTGEKDQRRRVTPENKPKHRRSQGTSATVS